MFGLVMHSCVAVTFGCTQAGKPGIDAPWAPLQIVHDTLVRWIHVAAMDATTVRLSCQGFAVTLDVPYCSQVFSNLIKVAQSRDALLQAGVLTPPTDNSGKWVLRSK